MLILNNAIKKSAAYAVTVKVWRPQGALRSGDGECLASTGRFYLVIPYLRSSIINNVLLRHFKLRRSNPSTGLVSKGWKGSEEKERKGSTPPWAR